jgi:hypothetical protein
MLLWMGCVSRCRDVVEIRGMCGVCAVYIYTVVCSIAIQSICLLLFIIVV